MPFCLLFAILVVNDPLSYKITLTITGGYIFELLTVPVTHIQFY